ncbi:MAG: ABC transporter substrate-binding protein [Patescibacteria group bacterium]
MDWNTIQRQLRRLKRLLFWLPSAEPGVEQMAEATHDHALVLSVTSPERVPKWRQFRYMFRIMSRTERRAFLAALAIAAFALLAAGASILATRLVDVPVVGGTLTEALVGEPSHINPLDSPGNDVDADLVRLIYTGLFRFDGLEATPDLAESFAWSDDRKTLTVHLRGGARFHDGEPLTSEDIRFTLDSIKNPARKSPLLPAFRGVTVATTDPSTVVFTLDRPDPFFLTKLTLGIVPAHLWQDLPAETARLSDLNLKPIGAGPYRVKSFTRDSTGAIHAYTLERFENAAGIRPNLKNIVFQFFTSRKEAQDALKADLVDALAFVDPKNIGMPSGARITDVRVELPQETVAFFNLKNSMLSQQELRQALALAVNPRDIADAFHGSSDAVSGPYPFDAIATSSAFIPSFDLERARTILTNAGWALPENGNVRIWKPPVQKETRDKKQKTESKKQKNKRRTTPDILTGQAANASSTTELSLTISVAEGSALEEVADVLKRSWSLLGARVTVNVLPMEELLRHATRDRDAQVVLLNILLGPTQDLLPFWSSRQAVDRGVNISNLRDRAVDAALERVRSATTSDDLRAARAAVSETILRSTPALFLARPVAHYFISSKIHAMDSRITAATFAERFQHIERWHRKTGWRWK